MLSKSRYLYSSLCILSLLLLYLTLAFFSEKISFGSDNDASLVAYSAQLIQNDRAYLPSRLPGSPGFEALMSLFISSKDARLAKCIIAIFAVGAVLLLLYICWAAGCDPDVSLFSVLIFSLYPVVVQNTFVMMDYHVSLFFILLASILLHRSQSHVQSISSFFALLAGLAVAFATSVRITSLLYAPLVIAIVVFDSKVPLSSRIRLMASFAIGLSAVGLFFIPLITLYGVNFLSGYFINISIKSLILYNALAAIKIFGGILGFAFFSIIGLLLVKEMHIQSPVKIWMRLSWGLRALILFGILNSIYFFKHPYELAYHIPLLASLSIVMALWFPYRFRLLLSCTIVVLILSSFFIITPNFKPGIGITQGSVLNEWQKQKNDRVIFKKFESIINNSNEPIIVIGYLPSANVPVWFFNEISAADSFLHTNNYTLWGTLSGIHALTYRIGNTYWSGLIPFHTRRGIEQFIDMLNKKTIETILFIASSEEERFELPAEVCAGKKCIHYTYQEFLSQK